MKTIINFSFLVAFLFCGLPNFAWSAEEPHANVTFGKLVTTKIPMAEELLSSQLSESRGTITQVKLNSPVVGTDYCLAVSVSLDGSQGSGTCVVSGNFVGDSESRDFAVSLAWPGEDAKSLTAAYLGLHKAEAGQRFLPPNIELSNYIFKNFASIEEKAKVELAKSDKKRTGEFKLSPAPFAPFYCVAGSVSLDRISGSGTCLVDGAFGDDKVGIFFSVHIRWPGQSSDDYSVSVIDEGF